MLAIAWQTVRGRWVSFAGMFISLFLGVWLLTAIALTLASTSRVPLPEPERFASAPTVVYPTDTLRVETNQGERTARLEQTGSLPTEVVRKVQALGDTVVDRSFFAQMVTVAQQQTGHAWSSAAFGPLTLVQGREPRVDSEIVISDGQAKLHDTVQVLTHEGPKTYTVSGLVARAHSTAPIFFTDTEAERLSPPVNALVSYAPPSTIRQIVGNDARVLTGSERYLADPNPNRNQKALNNMQIVLGIASGFTAFVVAFVVASTAAFIVAQRQHEFALLRAVGATPGQVRRMVLLEITLLGLIASFGGAMAGASSLPLFTDWLIRLDVAPPWFTAPVELLPAILAAVIGVGVALIGTWAASSRASRVRPLAALRMAEFDERGMTKARWVWAWVSLAAGAAAISWITLTQPRLAVIPQIYMGMLLLPIVTVALFAPSIVPPLIRLLTWPLQHARGAAGLLARQNALAAVRRTVSTAIPVLLIVSLFASLLGATDAITAAKSAGLTSSIKANYVVVPVPATVLTTHTIAQVQAVPGVTVAAAAPLQVFALEDAQLRAFDAEVMRPAMFQAVIDIPIKSGSLADFNDNTIIVGENWEKEPGQKIEIWLADGTKKVLTIAAVTETRATTVDAYVTPTIATNLQTQILYVKTEAQASLAALRAAVEGQGARVTPAAEWIAASKEDNVQASQTGILIVLGLMGMYSAIAVVNTLVIASAGRLRDIVCLRRIGATRRQIYWFVATESLLVVAIGAILAVFTVAFNAIAHYIALSQLAAGTSLIIPWTMAGITIGVCALLVLATALVSVALVHHKK